MKYKLIKEIHDREVFYLDNLPEDITCMDYKNNVDKYRLKEVYKLFDDDGLLISEQIVE